MEKVMSEIVEYLSVGLILKDSQREPLVGLGYKSWHLLAV